MTISFLIGMLFILSVMYGIQYIKFQQCYKK